MVMYVSLLVALAGVLAYALSANGKVCEIGRLMFGCGLLAFLLDLPGHGVNLLPR